jgi:hypothetical protein
VTPLAAIHDTTEDTTEDTADNTTEHPDQPTPDASAGLRLVH